ncbi:unnamed protein product [Nesidiocoris tenuis]|uniref:Uncharacterized protein n=1 Tax=Nesidiocoris tenuis TaxID=355587 RepID=A0A6H5FWM7_9HEMI|nr:unnamed protein product [Nesidiocoris tenuis]
MRARWNTEGILSPYPQILKISELKPVTAEHHDPTENMSSNLRSYRNQVQRDRYTRSLRMRPSILIPRRAGFAPTTSRWTNNWKTPMLNIFKRLQRKCCELTPNTIRPAKSSVWWCSRSGKCELKQTRRSALVNLNRHAQLNGITRYGNYRM